MVILYSMINSWAGNNIAISYVKLYPNTNVAALEKKLPAFLNKYGQAQLKNLGMTKKFHLQPVSTFTLLRVQRFGID